MRVKWTRGAATDLVRLHGHLEVAAPEAATRVVRQLTRAPDRLVEYPRLGEKLEGFEPREVRRILVGRYELRYEIADETIFILRIWHGRENRAPTEE